MTTFTGVALFYFSQLPSSGLISQLPSSGLIESVLLLFR